MVGGRLDVVDVDLGPGALEHNGVVIGSAVRAVLLDIDDTLVDTQAAFSAAISAVVARWMPGSDESVPAAALAHWVADRHGHFRAYTRGELTFVEQRRRRAVDLHLALGGPSLDGETFRVWEEHYERAFRGAWRAFEEVAGFLDRLEAAGLAIGAITNAGLAHQRDKLDRVGLKERIPVLVTVDDLGVGKPDPRVFALACSRLGVAAREAVYVGDELDVDARGARDAGLTGVWIDRRGRREEAGTVDVPAVETLTELADRWGI